jgi:hypothetical protein
VRRWTLRNLPGAPERVRFGIKNDLVEIQRVWRRVQQIEIFECLGQREALHFIMLLFCDDVRKSGITGIGAAIFHEIAEELLSNFSRNRAI